MSGSPMESGAPPPGTGAMGLLRWVIVALVAVVAAVSVLGAVRGGADHASGGDLWYCPMHPQVVQDHPGSCPICSMTLVPRPKGASTAPSARMTTSSDGGAIATGPGRYYCPMHPEVHSDDPNATCPKCGGMKLVPRPGAAAPGVPGLVAVELPAERIQLSGMRTAKVTRTALGGALRAPAVVTASERGYAQINLRFSGFIEKLLVAETGQRVRRGQILATVYSPEVLRVQQELLTARRWNATDNPHAAHGGAPSVAPSMADDARRRLELLGVSATEIETLLREGKPTSAVPVRSPVDGYIVAKTAVQGGAVQPGLPLFEVADLSVVWVMADVAEADLARVRIGQAAKIVLAAHPAETFTGKVQLIQPTLDAASRTGRARIEVRNPRDGGGTRLLPGMYGTVELAVAGASALTVPTEAIVDTGDVQYVFLALPQGRFEPRRIRRGLSAGDQVQVLEGVAEGDTIVTTANFLLDSESRLRAALSGQTP